MDPKEEAETERLLARGGPGPQRADALWRGISGQLPRPKRARWWTFLVLAPAAMAAGALLVWPADGALVARGGDGVPVEVRASCGLDNSPCRVGQPVYLQLVPHGVAGQVVLTLEQRGEEVPLALPMRVGPAQAEPVPVKVIPEPSDVGGLVIRARLTASDGGTPTSVSLRLRVEP